MTMSYMHYLSGLLGLSYQMMPGMRPVIPTSGVNSQARILVPHQMDAGVKTGQKQPRENLRREGNDTLNFNLRDEKDPREKVSSLSLSLIMLHFLLYGGKWLRFCMTLLLLDVYCNLPEFFSLI